MSASARRAWPKASSLAVSASGAVSSGAISSRRAGEIAAPARKREPGDAELEVDMAASLRGDGRRLPLRDGEVPCRLLERPAFELDPRGDQRELGIRLHGVGREA